MKAIEFIKKHKHYIMSLCKDVGFLDKKDVFQEICIVLLRHYPELDEKHYEKLMHVTAKHQRAKLYQTINRLHRNDEKQLELIRNTSERQTDVISECLRLGKGEENFELFELFVQGYSQVEIAETLNLTYNVTKKRTRKIRNYVTSKYKELYGEEV